MERLKAVVVVAARAASSSDVRSVCLRKIPLLEADAWRGRRLDVAVLVLMVRSFMLMVNETGLCDQVVWNRLQ